MSRPFAVDLSLLPVARHPLRLADATVTAVIASRPESVAAVSTPAASVVLVTHNNVVFTRLCLATVLADTTSASAFEVIVVDNASTDETPEYLTEIARQDGRVRWLRNTTNFGFAPAVNQGLGAARGDVLVLLNNDTLVPPGWLDRLRMHLTDPTVGLVGPVTNAAPNEGRVEAPYTTFGGFEAFAEERARVYSGRSFEIEMLTMFCLAMRRDTYERLGPLDEQFEVGTFEDDDYSRRAHEAGLAVVCAEDVHVHHFGQATFGQLVPSGQYAAIVEANRRRFEKKWETAWTPHRRRVGPAYGSLIDRLRTVAGATLPIDATVLVVSRGDDALLQLGADRRGWHFPRLSDGTYAGHYPADSAAAIAHLEQLREDGADHLLFPSTALWWLEHYGDLRRHLAERYLRLANDPRTCVIYRLDRAVAA